MVIPSASTGPTRLPVRTGARVHRTVRGSLLSRQATHSVAVALQYAAATVCLAVLTWIVMLLVYAPFSHLH
jgi:hypothetical protein